MEERNIISTEEVDYVANLARVELSDAEKEKFSSDLSSILGHFKDLSELNVSDVLPINFLETQENQTRTDELADCPEDEKEAIRVLFPQREGDLLKVKAVLK